MKLALYSNHNAPVAWHTLSKREMHTDMDESIFITALADPYGETSEMILGLNSITYSVIFYHISVFLDNTERTD